ncbi:MAG TPA: NUDIX hydrolase [Gemmatimonadales bacterium]|nr:NUDIX hydrolase [Gemmatimonadales bacterium]
MTDSPPTISSRREFSGRIINVDVDTVRFPDGSQGELEMVRHPGAAAVVPVLSEGDDPVILLIRQYRYAAGGPIWEVPAGTLEPGEAPEACARRELSEETGALAQRFDFLTTIYTTPGFTDERIHLFSAHELKIEDHARQADEFLEVHPHQLSRALGMIRDGELRDAKSICAVLFYAGFRAGL